jgi:hypothetical protein
MSVKTPAQGTANNLLLAPKMSEDERDEVDFNDEEFVGIVYNTTASKLQFYDGTIWIDLH